MTGGSVLFVTRLWHCERTSGCNVEGTPQRLGLAVHTR